MSKSNEPAKRFIPFDPQRPASENVFVGRAPLIAQLTESCRDLHSYGLIGEPGVGKTSLLLALKRSLLSLSAEETATRILVPVYLEFYRTRFASATSILEAILTGLMQAIEIQTGLVFPLDQRRDLELQAREGRFERPLASILDWYFDEARRTCQLVLLFDDLHRGEGCVWLNEALSILRPVVAVGKDMSMVLSGELPLEREFRNDVSPLRNLVAGQISLGLLLPDEVGSLVRVAQDFEWEVEPGCEAQGYELTQGHPYKLHYYLLEAIKTHGMVSRLALEAVHSNEATRAYLLSILKERSSFESSARPGSANPKRDGDKADRPFVDFILQVGSDGRLNARSSQGEATDRLKRNSLKKLVLASGTIENDGSSAQSLKIFGQGLYDLLLPSKIHTHFEKTEAAARSANARLRLRMQIEHDAVARLPLEFMYRKSLGYFLAVNPDTVLSRYLNLPFPGHRVRRRDGPLHLLVIVSDPSDQTRLDPDEWERILRVALVQQINQKDLTIQVVKQATRKRIRDALLSAQPDIIQFIGHGVYREGQGYLALVNENTGKTWLVNDEAFANIFLGAEDHLGLVSLMTCESAKSDSPQGFSGIAPKIVQRGVPAVVAMQYLVLLQTARLFLEDFYTAIAARNPIDWAVQAGRKAVSLELGLENREFATPVLYMRGEDGVVF